jgi:hypothetical protein
MVDWTRNSFSRHVTYLFIRDSFEFVLFSVVGKKLLVHWKNCTNSKKLCPGKAMPNSSIYIIKLKATCFWYVFFIRFLLSLMNLNNGVRSTENKNKKKNNNNKRLIMFFQCTWNTFRTQHKESWRVRELRPARLHATGTLHKYRRLISDYTWHLTKYSAFIQIKFIN